ncbi:MAG: S9 family peptidase, partial [Gemmatimonadales bacterium]
MIRRLVLVAAAVILGSGGVLAQAPADSALLTVDRIYAGSEFRGGSFGPLRWLGDGSAYTTLERSAEAAPEGRDIVRYDTESGARSILVPAARLVPAGGTEPLEIEDYGWSGEGNRLLIFTNSERVWRTNTRG